MQRVQQVHDAARRQHARPRAAARWRAVRPGRLNLLAAVLILALAFPNAGLAEPAPADQASAAMPPGLDPLSATVQPAVLAGEAPPYAPEQETTLELRIISSPWAVLDHNDPGGGSGPAPNVFVVEAVVTNTGPTTATEVVVTLDYNEDPVNGWVLVPGENSVRTQDELAPGAAYHAYWFARYSTVIGASHLYTISAAAANASPVATSDNSYGNPEPGKTVKTGAYVSAANSGIVQTSANVVVGVAFTVTVDYQLGSNPLSGIFSPVGNPDFDPGAYRLLSSQLRFYNAGQTWQLIVPERLYHPSLPAQADFAEATYTFIAVQPTASRLCPYAGVDYGSQQKYDNDFCTGDTIIPITGTVTFAMDKAVSALQVQQGQVLTYTIRLTNSGTLPLSYVWVWDEVNSAQVSIITPSIQPPSDPDETTAERVAWYVGTVPPATVANFSFAVLVDGQGQDLAAGTALVNHAFVGVNPGSLAPYPALTDTVTTTLLAPTVAVSKSDGRTAAQPGETLTYTLRITNSGSLTATGLVISDVLPAEVVYVTATAIPPETSRAGQTLVWNNLGPIAANGGTVLITLPVAVGDYVPEGTVLTDTLKVRYTNPAGHPYTPQIAVDTTTVQAPVLAIAKSDYPDPVLSGNLITYTLRYTNSGSAAADGLVISDVVPLSTTFASCSGGLACAMQGGVVSWTVGTLPAGGQGTVCFSVQVSATLPTGTLIRNTDYGLRANHHPFVAGPLVTTLVNRNAGFIEGYAFVDSDGDGIYEGEPGLPGVTVTLYAATVPVTTTDGNGYYRFRVEAQEAVSVAAALPAGYFRTTPGVVLLYNHLGQTQTIPFGYAPLTSTFGVLYGTVYDDLDHDAQQQLGEPGLAGVAVASAQAWPITATTDTYGHYTLRFTSSGAVTLSETNPPFYVSTTPDTVHTTATVGSSGPSPIDFGDFLGIHVTGLVFEDLNVNGARDGGEGGLAGVTVAVDGQSGTTAGDGTYGLFLALGDDDPVWIHETDLPGYLSTNAVPGPGMTRLDANTLRIDSPVSGTVYAGGDFGDILASAAITISGMVWDDNGAGGGGLANGLPDGSEPGLAGAEVRLSSGLSQTTAAGGAFLLHAPAGQAITVTEVNPPGYASTNAIPGNAASKWDNDTLVVAALAGGSTSAGNLFGDVLAGSVAVITGTVYDDSNENALLDGGELGLAGLVVTLEISGGSAIAVRTDAAGHYQLAMAPGQMARLMSSGPGGSYYPTTPESLVIQPPAAGLYPGNDFGYSDDSDAAVIYGTVYDDIDGDGQQSPPELGLPGVLLALSNGMTTTTDANGCYTFALSETGPFQVEESDPPDYHSTTPNVVQVDVQIGHSYEVNFGDRADDRPESSFFGTVFDDQNVNGAWDSAEPALAGVTVTISTIGGTPVPAVVSTNGWGQYTFLIEVAGTYTVSESDPPGYLSTNAIPGDPAVVKLDNNTLRATVAVSPGMDLGNNLFGDVQSSQAITVSGYVWDDNGAGGGQAGDGQENGLEPRLAGATIQLSSGLSQTTAADGGFSLHAPPGQAVTLSETNPPGYVSTNAIPGPQATKVDNDTLLVNALPGGGVAADNRFGDVQPADVGIAKWAWPGTVLAGETLTYTLVFSNSAPFYAQDAYITDTLPGGVVLGGVVSQPAGLSGPGQAGPFLTWYTPTLAAGAAGTIVFTATVDPAVPNGTILTNSVQIHSNMPDTNPANDQDEVATYVGAAADLAVAKADQPDPVAAGAVLTYTLTWANHGVSAALDVYISDTLPLSVTFGGVAQEEPALPSFSRDGLYLTWYTPTLAAGAAGTIVFTVTVDPAASGTITNSVAITGSVFDPLPGNNADEEPTAIAAPDQATLHGYVYHDADGDGARDPGEAGLPDILVAMDGTFTSTTDASGYYYFLTTIAGWHRLVETDPPGYTSTTPNEVDVNVELGNSYQVDFGDAPITSTFATIQGTVFADLDGDGLWDPTEGGLANVTVTLDAAVATTTDLSGSYSFSTSVPGTHTVVETDPPGYTSTTPNEVTVDVALGQSYEVNFGDMPPCTCPPDGYEEDDLPSLAAALLVGEAQTHDFCDDAGDWVTFTAEVGDLYTLTTSAWGQRADTILELYGRDGTTLLAANDDCAGSTDYSSCLSWRAPASGVYYVRLANRAGLEGCQTGYDLAVARLDWSYVYLPSIHRDAGSGLGGLPEAEVSPTGVISHTCPDAYEPDDTWELARPGVSGVVRTHSLDSDPVHYAADKDWIQFDLRSQRTVTFTVLQVTGTQTLLELYDGNGQALDVTGTTQLAWTALQPGRYYLAVSPIAPGGYGCADEFGYRLLMEAEPTFRVYLPVVSRGL